MWIKIVKQIALIMIAALAVTPFYAFLEAGQVEQLADLEQEKKTLNAIQQEAQVSPIKKSKIESQESDAKKDNLNKTSRSIKSQKEQITVNPSIKTTNGIFDKKVVLVKKQKNTSSSEIKEPKRVDRGNKLLGARVVGDLKPGQSPLITTTTPEGYDDLLEPQLTLVDIFFNGRLIGSSMATYTPETIIFEQPQQVLSLLPEIKQPEMILGALSLPLATNQALVCFYPSQANCGVLEPKEVGVIFDEAQLRANLFLNPSLLPQQLFSLNKYLPPSTSGASMLSAVSLVASGSEEKETIYSARIDNMLSYENYRLVANIESDNQKNTRLDQLSVTYEYEDMQYQLGSFQTATQTSSFFGQRDFLGVRAQSTLNSRTDLEQVSGSKLFLFLNERSSVDVYKDGQLIDTNIYQAGNIELDTRDFPQGAYNVELKITGDSGRERTESHFFSKSLQLPPTDETLFFAELGFPEDNQNESYPVATKQEIFRLGAITRPTDYFGYSGSIVKNPQQESLEFGSFFLANRFELQTNHAYTGDKEHASYYLLNVKTPYLFLSANYRRTYTQSIDGLLSENRLLAQNVRQTSVNLGLPLSGSLLNISARSSIEFDGKTNKSYGISWRKNILRAGNFNLDWSIDASKDDYENRLMTGLTLRFRKPTYNVNSGLKFRRIKLEQGNETYWNKNLSVNYREHESSLGSINHSLALNQSAAQTNATYQSSLSNDYGHGRLIVEHIEPNSSTSEQVSSGGRTGYSLTSRFNFASTDGEVAFGGSRQEGAGVMIDLTSIEIDGLSFGVVINGVERSRIQSGSTSFIALPAYQSYELVLSPKGETLVHFDNNPKQFTLYPGNINNYSWTINKVSVIVMQLFLNSQEFTHARMQDSISHARTDDAGWVQMEVRGAGIFTFIDLQGRQCHITINENEVEQSVSYLGSRNCQL